VLLVQVSVFYFSIHKGRRSLKKKPGHSYRFRKPAQVEVFGCKRRTCRGWERGVWWL